MAKTDSVRCARMGVGLAGGPERRLRPIGLRVGGWNYRPGLVNTVEFWMAVEWNDGILGAVGSSNQSLPLIASMA